MLWVQWRLEPPNPRQALSFEALSSITCSGCYLEPLPLGTVGIPHLASHENEEQNHLSLIGSEATKAIGAQGEQAPGEVLAPPPETCAQGLGFLQQPGGSPPRRRPFLLR